MVIDELGGAHRVVEVGGEEFGFIEGHTVIKKSRKDQQVLAQEQGAAHAHLQPVTQEADSVQEVLEAPVDVPRGQLREVEAQTLEDLGLAVRAGPQGQHGVGGRDAQRGEEDVAPRTLGSQQVVEVESEGCIARRDLEAGGALTCAWSLPMGAAGVTLPIVLRVQLTVAVRKDQQSGQKEERAVSKTHLLCSQTRGGKRVPRQLPGRTANPPEKSGKGRAPGR